MKFDYLRCFGCGKEVKHPQGKKPANPNNPPLVLCVDCSARNKIVPKVHR